MHRLLKTALTESRAATAFAASRKRHFVTCRLQHLHCSDANVRIMVADEGVVPKDHSTAERGRDGFGGRRDACPTSGVPGKPAIKSLPRIMRQRALPGDPERFGQEGAYQQRTHRLVRHPWRDTTQPPQEIDRAKQS